MKVLLLGLICCLGFPSGLYAQRVIVKPYVQPSDEPFPGKLDSKAIIWLTTAFPASAEVQFGTADGRKGVVRPVRISIPLGSNQVYFKYVATLPNLPLNSRISYTVQFHGKTLVESSFYTRKTVDQTTRFAVLGDMGNGSTNESNVVAQMARVDPEFLVAVGDICYPAGLFRNYMKNFWPDYNNTETAEGGTPLLRSAPLYAVLGNHDVASYDLFRFPDGIAVFYFFQVPRNGPRTPSLLPPLFGPIASVERFKRAAGGAYPALGFYSFDNGPAHFLCLDANDHISASDPILEKWIRDDLTRNHARWKMVFFHQPGFSMASKHFDEQKMRLLTPVFEECGVDVVFSGHVHNYQRSKPFHFKPTVEQPKGKETNVVGTFSIDEKFDGEHETHPNGIIYVITGGGGAKLYDEEMPRDAAAWTKQNAQWEPFTAKFVADRHSFSKIELNDRTLDLEQIDETGNKLDHIKIEKALPTAATEPEPKKQ